MRSLNYHVVGIDSSPAMLAEAVQLNDGDYVQADAGLLPFQDNAFDITTMITTLEFVSEPERVLREAVRVSRFGLLLGVMNRHSLLALSYRRSSNPLWRDARFFTTRELVRMIETATDGNSAKITWRTTLWPHPCSCALRLPWGGFIGIAVRWLSIPTFIQQA
jgi:ubiquinone/menaquinone biosynthesis C-methylase UbiE